MTENASPLIRSLARIVVGDLEQAVAGTTHENWQETLAMILTYAKDEELVSLCQRLGEQLEKEGWLNEAMLCAVCAIDIPAMMRLGLQIHPDCSVRSHLSTVEALLILCSMTNPQELEVSDTAAVFAHRFAVICAELKERGMLSVTSRPLHRAQRQACCSACSACSACCSVDAVRSACGSSDALHSRSRAAHDPCAAHDAHAACNACDTRDACNAEALHSVAARAAHLPARARSPARHPRNTSRSVHSFHALSDAHHAHHARQDERAGCDGARTRDGGLAVSVRKRGEE